MSSSFPPNQQPSAWACLPGFSNNDVSASNHLKRLQTMMMHRQRQPLQPRGEIEKYLTAEFNKLSIDEQVKALEDIYSAGSELKENPVLIDQLLSEFELQVERGNYPIYDLALNQDRSYVEDPAFRLKFLRANLHDVKASVQQMISFLREKAEYFGADKVARDITLDDLTPDELKLLLSGFHHIQDGTDRHGRPIFYNCAYVSDLDVESEIRVLYYTLFNVLIPMHSAQMKGVVSVLYNLVKAHQARKSGLGDMQKLAAFMKTLPYRTTAFHVCLKKEPCSVMDPFFDALVQLGLKAMPNSMKGRAQVHHGSPMEIQYHLSSYGIPQDTFPVNEEGNLREDIRNAWFYKHLASQGGIKHDADDDSLSTDEESSDKSDARRSSDEDDQRSANSAEDHRRQNQRVVPRHPYTNRDVLLGKGYEIQNHAGNAAFRDFLSEHQEEYDSAPRRSRRTIAKTLTRALMATGVRFWHRAGGDNNNWVETSFDEAEKKVSQVFRSARKKNKA